MRFRPLVLIMLTALSLLPLKSTAQEIHHPHCLYGCPSGTSSTNNLIIRKIYILSSNTTTKFSDWAAYKITKETIGSGKDRHWKADPLLKNSETLEPPDYRDAHRLLKTDRGHQVPLASFTGTPEWKTTNYLSNITPQKSNLNQGPWKKLEEATRKLAKQPQVKAVYAMTGPLYERSMPPLPNADEAHLLPSGYWKILAVPLKHGINLAAFIFDQETPKDADFCTHLTTVNEVEQRSKLNFFHEISEIKQEEIENKAGALTTELGCLPLNH